MTNANRIAQAALALVGGPFRLHGRDPTSGLDCLGVVAVALESASISVQLPCDYTLKNRSASRALTVARDLGLIAVEGKPSAGDVVLLRVGTAQLHFALCAAPLGFVHAHAGLRKVVLSPTLPEGNIVGHWRVPSL